MKKSYSVAVYLNKAKRWSKDKNFCVKQRGERWEVSADGIRLTGKNVIEPLKKLVHKLQRPNCTLCGKKFILPSPSSQKKTCYRHSSLSVMRHTFMPKEKKISTNNFKAPHGNKKM